MPSEFAKAIQVGDMSAVKGAAKTDYHSHHYFGAPIEAVERWLGHGLKRPPPKLDGLQGMHEYAASALDPHFNNMAAAVAESLIRIVSAAPTDS